MTSIAFHSAKGGAGCTTTATLYALYLSRTGHEVHLSTAGNAVQLADVASILAVPTDNSFFAVDPRFTAGLSLRSSRDNVINVVDLGYNRADPDTENDTNVLVVRNDYLSLRRALSLEYHALRGAVVLKTPGWVLDEKDVSDCLSMPILEVLEADAKSQRALDAGLLVYRAPAHRFLGLDNLIGVHA